MPSFNIHLSIAKRYADKNSVSDLNAFYKGTLAPDMTEDKVVAHFGEVQTDKRNVYEGSLKKVNLSKYLNQNEIKTDYDRAYFLHLIADWMYFCKFLDLNMQKDADYDQFLADLYYTYDKLNDYLSENYNLKNMDLHNFADTSNMEKKINISKAIVEKEKKEKNYTAKMLFNGKEIDKFIEEVSDIDLETYALKFKKNPVI